MKHAAWLVLLAMPSAHALDAACETYVAAVEKSARQPARHSVTESSGLRMEAIVIDGKAYSKVDGKWMEMKSILQAERQLNAQLRSGAIKLSACKALGSETVDGVATTVFTYSMTIAGLKPQASKVYIGKDGLIYAQAADDAKVRYRYTSVTAPIL